MTEKEKQIIKSAIRLFAQEGIGVPTARIAKEADVSNGTLFNYFKTKQALIDGVYLSIKEEFAGEILGDVDTDDNNIKHTLFNIWNKCVRWACNNPLKNQVLDMLYSSQKLSDDVLEVGENYFTVVFETMGRAIENGIITDAPLELLLDVAHGQMVATICHINKHKLTNIQIEGLIHISFDIYWKGIAA